MRKKITTLRAKSRPAATEFRNDMPQKDMDILDHIERIVEISKKKGVDNCLLEGKDHLNYITEKLKVSPLQALLFSHFLERCTENQILIGEIAESLKCSKVRTMNLPEASLGVS